MTGTDASLQRSAFAGIAFLSSGVFDMGALPRATWHDVPGVSLTLPEAGRYALDGVLYGAIQANPPAHFVLVGRLVDGAGNEVVGGRMLGAAFAQFFDGATGPDFGGDNVVAQQGHAATLLTVTGPTVVKMQAYFERREPPPSGAADPIFAWVINYTDGVTSLRAVQVRN